MFNMFGGKPVPKPSTVVVVATRQRNETEVTMQKRTGGRGGRQTRVTNFNLLEANEVIVVNAVRGEHGGFVYVAGDSADKQTRHHQSKANRLASWKVSTDEYVRADDSLWAEEAVVVRQRALFAQKTAVNGLRSAVADAEDPELMRLRDEATALRLRLTVATLADHAKVTPPVRKVAVGGDRTVVATTDSGGTVSDEPKRKK